jgi:ferric-dicitrate binding protein FerR (iron transport regulator)
MDTSQSSESPTVTWDMLDRYLTGESAPDEATTVKRYLAQHPAAALLLKQPATLWMHQGDRRMDVEQVWNTLMARGDFPRPAEIRPDDSQPRRLSQERSSDVRRSMVSPAWQRRAGMPRGTWFGLRPVTRAAVVGAALAAILGIGWMSPVGKVVKMHLFNPSVNVVPTTTYATRNGQRAEITLPDGSLVTLNVASRLRVPANFASGNRRVQLSGEAMFSVAHRRQSPFTVVTEHSVTHVLGTTFVVRDYAADAHTTVAVRDGKVSVNAMVVTGQEQAIVDSIRGTRVQPAHSTQFAFALGILAFDGVSLQAAVPALNRWYDADIRIADPALATAVVQGAFPSGSLSDLAKVLAFTFDAKVVREGHVLTLYSK